MHDEFAKRGNYLTPVEPVDPYYHIEYCFVRGEPGPVLKVDIEPEHLQTWMDEMLGKGGVRILNVTRLEP